MTWRRRSSVIRASLALPFQIRQCRRLISVTITVLAFSRSGVSIGRGPAVFSAWGRRLAMGNQSRLGDAGIDQQGAQPRTAVGECGREQQEPWEVAQAATVSGVGWT